MDILDDMGVSNYQQKFFLKVNYSFKTNQKCFLLAVKLFSLWTEL